MSRRSAHSVIRYPCWVGCVHPCRELQERVHPSLTAVVEIEVHAAVVREDEVPDCVDALDIVRVVEECVEKPGVFFLDEREVVFICPEPVFVVWVE